MSWGFLPTPCCPQRGYSFGPLAGLFLSKGDHVCVLCEDSRIARCSPLQSKHRGGLLEGSSASPSGRRSERWNVEEVKSKSPPPLMDRIWPVERKGKE